MIWAYVRVRDSDDMRARANQTHLSIDKQATNEATMSDKHINDGGPAFPGQRYDF